MSKYDVFADPRASGNLLIVVQDDLFDMLDTRLAIPLLPEDGRRTPLNRLNPVFPVGEKSYVLYTQHMVAVPRHVLKGPVANLRERRDEITAAVDFLIQGF